MSKDFFKKRILFIGIPDMAYICLDGLLMSGVNIVGVLGAKKEHNTYVPFKNFVQGRKLNFIEYDNLDDEDFLRTIKALEIDLAVVCSFNYKVPKALLECSKNGFVNVHPSLLPKYRGANPYSAVIINNEKMTGVTLHFMDESFDTGDIIAQEPLEISKFETMGTLFNRLNLLSVNLLLEVLREFELNPLSRIKQPQGDFVKGQNLSDSNLLINFSKSANDIERFIRAVNPFLPASTVFRHNVVKILSAQYIKSNSKEPHGTIVKIENDKFFVSTGDGLLIPDVLQFGSFFIGSSMDFIKILNPKVGERFL